MQAIQDDTTGAVSAIGSIAEVISRINDLQTTIASAVEEQTATTSEIARSIAEAAAGADRVDGGVREVSDATRTTVQTVEYAQQALRRWRGSPRSCRPGGPLPLLRGAGRVTSRQVEDQEGFAPLRSGGHPRDADADGAPVACWSSDR